MTQVALSEVLGALSYALDITEGEPPGHAVRTTAIGMRLGEFEVPVKLHREVTVNLKVRVVAEGGSAAEKK